jgi:hypothetical protein
MGVAASLRRSVSILGPSVDYNSSVKIYELYHLDTKSTISKERLGIPANVGAVKVRTYYNSSRGFEVSG